MANPLQTKRPALQRGQITVVTGPAFSGKTLIATALLNFLRNSVIGCPVVLFDDACRAGKNDRRPEALTKAKLKRLVRTHRYVVIATEDSNLVMDLGFEHRMIVANSMVEVSRIHSQNRIMEHTLGKIARRKPYGARHAAFHRSRQDARNVLDTLHKLQRR